MILWIYVLDAIRDDIGLSDNEAVELEAAEKYLVRWLQGNESNCPLSRYPALEEYLRAAERGER